MSFRYALRLLAAVVLTAGTAGAQPVLISEFEPNPALGDPPTQSVELSGPAGTSFSGVIVNVESDPGSSNPGDVNSFEAVAGTFDANGLLTVSVPDLENPSFTLVLTTSFTGDTDTDIDTDDDGTPDDLSAFGTILDAIGTPDLATGEVLYGAALGGTDLAFTGAEPELIFRDASVGALYAVNVLGDPATIFDASGATVPAGDFDTDPSAATTFGAINPTTGAALPDVAVNELRVKQGGADNDSFVELAGPASTDLTGLALVGVDNDGDVVGVIDLAGQAIPADGYFLIAQAENTTAGPGQIDLTLDLSALYGAGDNPTAANDDLTVLLVSAFTGAVGTDLDTDDDGGLDATAPLGAVLDGVALVNDGAFAYAADTVGPDGSFTPAGGARVPNATGDFQQLAFSDTSADTPGEANSDAQIVTVEFSPADGGAIAENGGTVSFDVVLDTSDGMVTTAGVTGDVVVTSGVNDGDFGVAPASFSFPAGSADGATVTVTVTATDDATFEGPEAFELGFAAVAGADVGAADAFAFSITDDDPLPPVPTGVAINELRLKQGGPDNDRFVELSGAPGTNLGRLSIVALDQGGQIEGAVSLGGQTVPADGYFLVAPSTFTLGGDVDYEASLALFDANGNDLTVLLVADYTGTTGDDLDATDDGTLDATPFGDVLDAVALVDDGDNEYATGLGGQTVGPDGTFTPAGAFRVPNGTGPFGQLAFGDLGDDTPGVANPEPVDPVEATILEARTLPNGTLVTVQGVVTRAEGTFTYFQDETAGLTIRQTSGSLFDAVAAGTIGPGTVLEVTGTLSEFRGLRQINEGDLDDYAVVGTAPVPAPQVVTLFDLSFSGEQYEAELVQLNDATIGGSDFVFTAATTYSLSDGLPTISEVTLRVPNAIDTRVEGTTRPDRANLVGVVGQFTFDDPSIGYQLLLIDPDDVEPLATEPGGANAVSIAEARASTFDQSVTIEGVITRAEGAFAYVQDDTGALAIRQTSGAFNAAVADGTIAPGTRVRLTGTLSQFSSSLQINGDDLESFEILGTADVPAPQTVTLAELAANGEQYEDELVRVENVTVQADGTFSAATTYDVTDPTDGSNAVTLRVPNSGDTLVDGLPIPDEPVTVTAIVGQFSSSDPAAGYQLLVIEAGDVGGDDGGSGGGAQAVSAAEARTLGAGTAVVVEGTVTRAVGAFLYLQDETGGLTVRQTSGDLFDAVADGTVGPGTVLRVTGTLSEFGALLQINGGDLDAYEVLGTADVPAPQVVTLAELAANGEDYEGELVRVNGVTVQGTGAFAAATTYGASDGSGASGAVTVRVPNADDSTVDGTPIPAGPVDLVGVVGQFNFDDPTTGYQLLLLDAEDVDAETTGGTAADGGPEAALALDVANPIRGGARVAFSVAEAGAARVALYDVLGREVAVLADGPAAAGAQSARLDASSLAPGVYVLRLETAGQALARTVTVVR